LPLRKPFMSAVAIMPPPMKPILLLSVTDVLIARTVPATRVARQKIVPTARAAHAHRAIRDSDGEVLPRTSSATKLD